MSEPRRPAAAPRRPAASPPARRATVSATIGRGSRPPRSERALRRRVAVVGLVLGLVLIGALFAFVYPTRTFLDQRAQVQRSESRLALLRAQNAQLVAETHRLNSDSEIERIAREQYGLLRPGERAFVIVPVPTSAPPTGG